MNKQLTLAAIMLGVSGFAQAQSHIETYSVYDVNHLNGTTVADAAAVVNRVIEKTTTDPQVVDAVALKALMTEINSKLDMLESIENRISALEKKSCTCCCGGESGESDTPEEPFNGHEYVDLGLPSGLLWATCNVGASIPEEYGDYFAWGETEPKNDYSWSTYKWCNGTAVSQTKYCTDSYYGTVDHKIVLDPEDDAARANWGGSWRMPTKEEQDELINNCTWTWTTHSGVNGYKVVGPNSNSIFLPASGYRYYSSLCNAGSWGFYWSSSLHMGLVSHDACCIGFGAGIRERKRFFGQSVRPVCAPSE